MTDEGPVPRDHLVGRLILALRSQGVTDTKVLNAIQSTPRELFVQDLFLDRAFEDTALPIDCGQTISQPYIVGLMTQALQVEPRHRVLEIGTGSGYQAAVLSPLCRFLYTVERYKPLLEVAEGRFRQLGFTNVFTRLGDGGEGWPEQAPFDRVIVTAAAPGEPKTLLAQLKPNGILVAPVGKGPVQTLVRYVGDGAGVFKRENLGDVRFVPLLPGIARDG